MSDSGPDTAPIGKGLTLGFRKTSLQLDPVQSQRALDLYPQLTISEIARMAIDLVIELKPTPKPPRFILTVEDQEAINRGMEILRGEQIKHNPPWHRVEDSIKEDSTYPQNCPCGDYGRPGHPLNRWCDEYWHRAEDSIQNERNSE